jgi:4-diphosphocytidyl-2-C-methyl-D-erythritol kinase
MPDTRVSTTEIFSDDALKRDSAPISRDEALAGGGRNDCQPVACRRHPSLARVIEELDEFGSARMSGTGSSVFVPMVSREVAEAAASELKCRYNVRAVGGLDESMLIRALDSETQDRSPMWAI